MVTEAKGEDVVTRSSGSISGSDTKAEDVCSEKNHDLYLRSALVEELSSTPQIIPVRGNLDTIRALMKGDCYMGRGCR